MHNYVTNFFLSVKRNVLAVYNVFKDLQAKSPVSKYLFVEYVLKATASLLKRFLYNLFIEVSFPFQRRLCFRVIN